MLNLMPVDFLIISAFILAGSVFQVATGVGLGLLAGPILIYFIDSASALQIALALNLILTLILLPFDVRMMSPRHFKGLSLWTLVGFPFGFVLFLMLSQPLLKIFAALVILLSVIQLRFFSQGAAVDTSPGSTAELDSTQLQRDARILGIGGSIAGAMTSALCIPGPMALWALLSTRVDPLRIRATVRAYFVVTYSLALLIHLLWSGVATLTIPWTLKLLPVLLAGIVIGLVAREHFKREFLRILFELLLVAMGIALLLKGIIDVI